MTVSGVVCECGEISPGGLGTAAGHSERAAMRAKHLSSYHIAPLHLRPRHLDGQPYITTNTPHCSITTLQHGQSRPRYDAPPIDGLAAQLTAPGTLVKCDASIKAMLVDIDSKNNNEYIIEELDEEHILVKETKINELKARLNEVSMALRLPLHNH